MKTAISKTNISATAALMRTSCQRVRANHPTGTLFSPGLLLRALAILVFAAIIASPALAQNIYVSNNTGYLGSPPNQAYISEYNLTNGTSSSHFITLPTSEVWGMVVSGANLYVPHDDSNPYTAGVNEYNATSGLQITYTVGNLSSPHGAAVGGSYLFALYGSGVVGEYDKTSGALKNSNLVYVSYGEQIAAWTDPTTNITTLYVSSNNSGGGLDHTGSIQKITVDVNGLKTSSGPLGVSTLNRPQGITVSPDGKYVFVVTQSTGNGTIGEIEKYDTSSGALKWTSSAITGTPFDIAAAGAALFVTRNTANAVGEYYASTGAEINASAITGLSNPTGIAASPAGCVRPPANMIAWYTFDQTGASQEDLASENTATAHSTTTIAGEVANALQFNGTNAYVEAPSVSTNNLGTSNFSIDAWVKIANAVDYSGVVVLLDKRDASYGYHMYLYNGSLGIQLSDSAGYANYGSTTPVPADNQWHLVAVTVIRNSTTGGVFYLDGAPIGAFNPTAHPGSLNSTAPLDIGVRSALQGGYGNFKGGIDEVEIFNRSLSLSEVLSIANAGPAGKCKCATPPSSMVAWYAFDQTGSSQSDLSPGHNNTATAYNTTSVAGEVANALQFNGTSSYVQAPAQSWLNVGTGDFSIDAWVKIANPADDNLLVAFLDKRDASPLRGYHFFLYYGQLGVQLADSLGYGNYFSTTTVPADNQWHLVAVTVTRNSHTGGVWYLDGHAIDTPFDPTGHPNSLNSSVPLIIGTVNTVNGGGSEFFKGALDELEIFNRALTPAEVLSLMQAGPAGKCK